MKESTTTHVVNDDDRVIIIKNVPCEEREEDGEQYFSDKVAKELENLVDAAKKLMQEVTIIDYSKMIKD